MSQDLVQVLIFSSDLLDGPDEGLAQGLGADRSTGLANGRQPITSPFIRTVAAQLSHQQTVRQHHQVHVPCLALAIA